MPKGRKKQIIYQMNVNSSTFIVHNEHSLCLLIKIKSCKSWSSKDQKWLQRIKNTCHGSKIPAYLCALKNKMNLLAQRLCEGDYRQFIHWHSWSVLVPGQNPRGLSVEMAWCYIGNHRWWWSWDDATSGSRHSAEWPLATNPDIN